MFIRFLFFCLCLVIGAANAIADDVVIFVIDPKAVVEQSKAFRSIQKQIAEKNTEHKKKATTQHDTIKTVHRELEGQKGMITQQEYEQRSRKIAEQARDYSKEAHANKAMLDNALSNATDQIDQVLESIMAEHVSNIEAREKGKKIMVFNKLNVVYASNGIDITDKVRRELNKRLPRVQVQFSDSEKEAKTKK